MKTSEKRKTFVIEIIIIFIERASLVVRMIKNLPAMQETWVRSVGWEHPWGRIWQPTLIFLPGESTWTEDPGGLQSMESLMTKLLE